MASKSVVSKEEAKCKKTAAPKPKKSPAQEVFFQVGGVEISSVDIMERAREDFAKSGHKKSEIKTIQVYVKPEDGYAYYVVNGVPEDRKIPIF